MLIDAYNPGKGDSSVLETRLGTSIEGRKGISYNEMVCKSCSVLKV